MPLWYRQDYDTLWNYNTENHTENLKSTENPCKSMKLYLFLTQKKNTLEENWKSHWKVVFVIQVLILHFVNHTEMSLKNFECYSNPLSWALFVDFHGFSASLLNFQCHNFIVISFSKWVLNYLWNCFVWFFDNEAN